MPPQVRRREILGGKPQLEDSGRIRDKGTISDLPEGQQKIWQVLALQQVILHLALHLREGVVTFLGDKEIARDSDPSAMSHPMQSQALESVTPTPEELKAMIPSVPVGAYPAWHAHWFTRKRNAS